MGNWKTTIKVRDLDEEQRLELTCKKCGRVTYATKRLLCEDADRSQKYLDEIEAKVRCKARGCRGHMRMAMVRLQEMSGFVGGLA
ncbi:hypothetical protein [Brucella haematophila]|uniref:Uncharacterized protein n=1 Tax=Brucella haematophila TaxID=419474 RepID=A0ABX1DQT9_9HYPH|nr:hypothetical protein [Brucella haematophila]NKC05294.1 hypothetical protein [Brucella haematophila]TMU91152.1 hypothetical protein FGI60_23055 [Brucella haematophila]